MAPGTDGNIISYDASGNPVAVATGSAGQVLTSAGAGAPPTFAAAGVAGISSSADATAISIDSSEVVRLPVGILRLQNATTGTADTDGLLIEASGNDVYINNKENADMYFRTNNTYRLKLHENGVLSASAGVALGFGTANTDSNVLDDYEEGTWDASIACGSGSITLNSSYNTCKYTKIGRMVQLNGSLTVSSVSSPSGDLLINGMPFSSGSGEGGERATGAFCMYNPTNGTPPGLICQIFGGYASIRVESSGSADRSQADHPQASSELRFTINYQIGN
jgi:hypothetical protein